MVNTLEHHAEALKSSHVAFERDLSNLLRHYLGKFVLYKDGNFISSFDSFQNAYNFAVERCGNVPLYIREVVENESPVFMGAPSIGLSYSF